MKVLDLGCAQSHVFEGWFASEDDFQAQLARGLLECPLCGDRHIEKRLSAPRLNLRAPVEVPDAQSAPPASPSPAVAQPQRPLVPEDIQGLVLRAVREVMAKTEDVGERFADEARRMHYGEIEQRSIRGRATVADAVELVEEGIDLLPLPDLDSFKQTLQ